MRLRGLVAVLALGLMPGVIPNAARAQGIDLGLGAKPKTGVQHVALLSETVQAKAGGDLVQVVFRVDPGFHVNSHTPKDELLIPTVLKLEPAEGVRVAGVEYPTGHAFKLPSSNDALDVYQGEFRVGVRLAVKPGTTTLKGTLRYQACDNAACFPPRTLPVTLTVVAR